MNQPTCPNSLQLADYCFGKLPWDEIELLESHLDECLSCQQTLNQLDEGGDTFIAKIRDNQAADLHQHEAELQAVLQGSLEPPTIDSIPQASPDDPNLAIPLDSADASVKAPPQPEKDAGNAPQSVADFIRVLAASQLMTAAAAREFLASLPPQKRPTDAKAAATHFAHAGKLTPYQARAIYQGKPHGLVIADREVLDILGRGGMGSVFKVRNRRLDRIEAMKVISAKKLDSAEAKQRFDREARAAARLNHLHVVATYDAGEASGVSYLCIEYVDGLDLARTVKERGPLPVEHAVSCVLQAASGLQAAHDKGIIHRDIKPHNLLLDREGCVKILDLGLARINETANLAAAEGLTQSGQIMGTVDYMSPEQTLDVRKVTPASDVYSLGCTLHFLLTGRPPFTAETLGAKMLAHHQQQPPLLSSVRADVPPALDAIFHKMLAKDPAQRYASMHEVIAALQPLVQAQPAQPLIPPSLSAAATADSKLTAFLSQMAASQDLPAVGKPPGSLATATVAPQRAATLAPAARLSAGRQMQRLVLALSALLALGVLGVLGILFTINTPQGVIEVSLPDETAADQVSIVVSAGGKQVAVIDKADRFQVQLRQGQYEVNLKDDDTTFALAKNTVTVKQGQKELVTVTRRDLPPGPPPIPPGIPPTQLPTTPVVAKPQFMLEFDGDDYIDIPGFKYDGSHPLTFEARLADWMPGKNVNSQPLFTSHTFTGDTFYGAWISLIGYKIDFAKNNNAIHIGSSGKPGFVLPSAPRARSEALVDLAVVFDGDNRLIFCDGKRVNNADFAFGTGAPPKNKVNLTRIGGKTDSDRNSGYGYRGFLQYVRLSKTARYQKNYVPEKTPAADADTMLLYRMDEGQGDVLNDLSGNNLHGKIVGAKWVSAASQAQPQIAQSPSTPPVTLPPPEVPSKPLAAKEWHELLPYVYPPLDAANGSWEKTAAGFYGQGRHARLIIPVEIPPGANYEARVRFKHPRRHSELGVVFPLGDTSQAKVLLKYWRTQKSGFDLVRGAAPGVEGNNSTVDTPSLEAGVSYELTFQVVNSSSTVTLSASLAGKPLLNWSGPFSELALHESGAFTPLRSFGVITENGDQGEIILESCAVRTTSQPLRILPPVPTSPEYASAKHFQDLGGKIGCVMNGSYHFNPKPLPFRKPFVVNTLDLGGTQVADSDLIQLKQLPNLQSVHLWGTGVKDDGFKQLASAPSLRRIESSSEHITDEGVSSLKPLAHQLELLGLSWAHRVTGKSIASLLPMPELRAAWVSGMAVGADGMEALSKCPKLSHITLQKNTITSEMVDHLQRCRNLRKLELGESKVSPADLARLRKALPLCVITTNSEKFNTSLTLPGKNLLAAIEITAPPVSEQWKAELGLTTAAVKSNQLVFVSAPPAEYDLHLVASGSGNKSRALRLPVAGKHSVRLVLDESLGKLRANLFDSALSHRFEVVQLPPGEAEKLAYRSSDFAVFTGTPALIVIQVRKQEIRVLRDGEPRIQLLGDFGQLPEVVYDAQFDPQALLLGCGRYAEHSFTVHQAALDTNIQPLQPLPKAAFDANSTEGSLENGARFCKSSPQLSNARAAGGGGERDGAGAGVEQHAGGFARSGAGGDDVVHQQDGGPANVVIPSDSVGVPHILKPFSAGERGLAFDELPAGEQITRQGQTQPPRNPHG